MFIKFDEEVDNQNLNFCRTLEPLCRVLSFNRITQFQAHEGSFISQSDDFSTSWIEIAAKISLWALAWILIIPGIIFISLKISYIDRVKQIVSETHMNKLFEDLQNSDNSALIKMDIIAETIRDKDDFDRVIIQNQDPFSCQTFAEPIFTRLPDCVLAIITPDEWKEQNRQTIQFLIDHFGLDRSERLFKMMGIDIHYLQYHGLPLTKATISKFLALTGFVHVDDMKRVFEDLQACSKRSSGYLHLSFEKVQEIVQNFTHDDFDHLSKEDYDSIWNVMTPLRMSTMFVDRFGKIQASQNRGCEINSIIEAIWIEQNHLHVNWEKMTQRDCDYTLMKSLVSSFTEESSPSIKGKVIRQKKGYGYLEPMVSAVGCYCVPMKALNPYDKTTGVGTNSEGMQRHSSYVSKLLFLPTQAYADQLAQKWQSIMGLFQPALGERGVLAIWPRIKNIVERDPAFKRFDLIGYSQGGTQASKVAALALPTGKVRKLIKICAPAEDEGTAQLFNRCASQLRQNGSIPNDQYVLKISNIWQPDDRTHHAEDKEMTFYTIEEDQQRVQEGKTPLIKQKIHWMDTIDDIQDEKIQAPESGLSVFLQAFFAVIGPHSEDLTYDGRQKYSTISTVNERDRVLRQINNEHYRWEWVRKAMGSWFYPTRENSFANQAENIVASSYNV
ncbi:MAG: hypothetical protein FJZ56_01845 [Chlamydiae bacterium]|nr:hypothetical protein [Chlamydiota bacterium]